MTFIPQKQFNEGDPLGSNSPGTVAQTKDPGTGNAIPLSQPVTDAQLRTTPVPVADGTNQTFVEAPAGALGVRGWLSAIFALLSKWPRTFTECGTLLEQIATDGWNALTTYDVNMAKVFGETRLLGASGRLLVDPLAPDVVYQGEINARNPSFSAPCNGYGTATIQIGGTWAGTITFEGTAYGSAVSSSDPLLPLLAQSLSITQPGTSVAGSNNLYRLPTSGLSRIQCRFSTATSGAPQITIVLSPQPYVAHVQVGNVNNVQSLGTVTTVTTVATVTTVSTVSASRTVGSAGATLDAAINTGAAPTNAVWTEHAPATDAAAALSVAPKAALTVANVKASAGNLYGISVSNPNASPIYIQFYNTSGTPTLGTAVVWWIPVAASWSGFIGCGPFALANFSTGIGIGASTTASSTGTPAIAPDVVAHYR